MLVKQFRLKCKNKKTDFYYQNEHKFNGVYSRKTILKIKDGACVVNPDKFESIGTHWIALYFNNNNVTYFDSLKFQHILKEIKKKKKKFVRNKYIILNI